MGQWLVRVGSGEVSWFADLRTEECHICVLMGTVTEGNLDNVAERGECLERSMSLGE